MVDQNPDEEIQFQNDAIEAESFTLAPGYDDIIDHSGNAPMPPTRLLLGLYEEYSIDMILGAIVLSEGEEVRRLFSIQEKVEEHRSLNVEAQAVDDETYFLTYVYPTLAEEEKQLYRIYAIDCANEARARELHDMLQQREGVTYVQFDELNELYSSNEMLQEPVKEDVSIDFIPNDPLYSSQWALKKMQCEGAWDFTLGSNVIVAVVDTGVDYRHPDLAGNMWKNAAGKYGYDFSRNNDNPMDSDGHGTHVAGTIAAVTNNNAEVASVAPKAKIMAVKVFPNAYDSYCANGIKYAVDNKANVINCSWGPTGRRPTNPTVEAAINYAYSKGVIVVFAAGNANDDVAYYAPANLQRVISVGATDTNDRRASFSNFGAGVTIGAPGVSILSLQNGSSTSNIKSGTSMAAPHIAGTVALMLEVNKTLGLEVTKQILQANSDPINADKPIGKRVNAFSVIRHVPLNILRVEEQVSHTYSGVSGCANDRQQQAMVATRAWVERKKQQHPGLRVRSSGHLGGTATTRSGKHPWPDNSRWCKTTLSIRCYVEFYKQ